MSLTYPSREEANRYRREIQEAVEAARKGEEPERNTPAWPAGLDRTILRGLPLPAHSRNCLLRARLMEGDNPFTVAEIAAHSPGVGPTTVRNLLIGIDEFLRRVRETPSMSARDRWRLRRCVCSEGGGEAGAGGMGMIVEERMLNRPPTEYHTLAVRFDMSSARIQIEGGQRTREFRDRAGTGAANHRRGIEGRP